MSINTHLGKTVPGLAAVSTVYACSTGTAASGAALNGVVIDRLGLKTYHLPQGETYHVAEPFASIFTTVGTTWANRKVTIVTKLQHGDSSGAGDMADLVTAASTAPSATASYWSTAMSSEHAIWTTGIPYAGSLSLSYNLSQFAKRYIRPVATITVPGNTTGAGDVWYVNMGVRFSEGYASPPVASSTSTSTST